MRHPPLPKIPATGLALNVYTMYTHGMKTKIQKWGNSLGIRIPKAFAIQLGIEPGKEVEVSLNENELRIVPTQTLEDLVNQITPENMHEIIDSGPPVGREIW